MSISTRNSPDQTDARAEHAATLWSVSNQVNSGGHDAYEKGQQTQAASIGQGPQDAEQDSGARADRAGGLEPLVMESPDGAADQTVGYRRGLTNPSDTPSLNQALSLLTVAEVASILRVTEHRVYEMVRRRLLPAVHLGRQVRIDEAALRAFICNGGQALPGGWRADPA